VHSDIYSRTNEIKKKRIIDPFFEDAINAVFEHKQRSIFLMDGAIGIGKTSNFTIRGPYLLAQHVRPRKLGDRMVRESLWCLVRESEKSAVETAIGVFNDAIFSPEIMALKPPPLKIVGSHPTKIIIEHPLSDGTWLLMTIEAQGFNNPGAEGRLRSREYLGGIVPEMQTVPFNVVTLLSERCGRWRSSETFIEREINGKTVMLNGVMPLRMVFADANIPERPHAMYDNIYDPVLSEHAPFHVIRPPAPVLPVKTTSLDERKLEQLRKNRYPETRYEGHNVIWVPNPKVYQMTKHFEQPEEDEFGSPIIENGEVKRKPWSGYNYWFQVVAYKSESYIRRMVIGEPDDLGGAAAVYQTFNRKTMVEKRAFIDGVDWYVGQDPGKYGAFVALQLMPDGSIHVFREFMFVPEDKLYTRQQLVEHVFPFIDQMRTMHPRSMYRIVVDPSAAYGSNTGEGSIQIIRELGYNEEPFMSRNQDTEVRRDGLGWFLEQGKFTVDPSCQYVIKGLQGGYKYKETKSGMISDIVEKNIYSHMIEALQYPVANLYIKMRKKMGNSTQPIGLFNSRG